MPQSILPPQASAAPELPLRQRLARIAPYFGGQRGYWALAIIATLIGAATEPLIPALLQPLLDNGFTTGTLPLWQVPTFIVGLFLIRGLAQIIYQYSLSRITNAGMLQLRKDLFERVQYADVALFSRQSASTLSNTVVYEVQNGASQLVQAFLTVSRDGFTLVALLIYLIYLNWQLTLTVAIVMPLVAWIMKTLSRRLYRITKNTQTATDALAYVVEENVLAWRAVRLHGAQQQQQQRFAQLSEQLHGLNIRSTLTSALMTPTTQIVAAVALSGVICLALWQGRAGGAEAAAASGTAIGVTVGSFVAFISAMLMLIAPLRRLADIVNPITRGVAALERGLMLMQQIAPETGGTARPALAEGATSRALSWRDVRVAFGDEGSAALDGVNLHVAAGEVVALVGSSGAGKTTLANTLARFVEPVAGEVALDGVPLPQWDLAYLRAQLAVVSQDVVMFNDTVAANVALGAQQVDEARVRQCLEAAHLLDFVNNLPQGMHTSVGHNAAQLSGGQRQRLAIARALYRDAPVLILDEATSALDAESERIVQAALDRLMRGRTTIVIAHRLSTIERANRVVVMDRGRIVETGTHAELLAADGLYARLHAAAARPNGGAQSALKP